MISRTPPSTSFSASATICATGRETSEPRVGYHAESAELVAAFLDGQESRDAPRTGLGFIGRRQMDELVLDGIFRFHDTLAGASPLQRVGKAMIGLRTYDEIDRRDAAENFVALRLGHAAGDADQHLAALERLGLFSSRRRPSSE